MATALEQEDIYERNLGGLTEHIFREIYRITEQSMPISRDEEMKLADVSEMISRIMNEGLYVTVRKVSQGFQFDKANYRVKLYRDAEESPIASVILMSGSSLYGRKWRRILEDELTNP